MRKHSISEASSAAFSAAQSGNYRGWRQVETALRARYPAVRAALAATSDKQLIDQICREQYKVPTHA